MSTEEYKREVTSSFMAMKNDWLLPEIVSLPPENATPTPYTPTPLGLTTPTQPQSFMLYDTSVGTTKPSTPSPWQRQGYFT